MVRTSGWRAAMAGFVLFGVGAVAAEARELKLPASDPVVLVDVPDTISVKMIKRGVEMKTEDGEVFVWFEVYGPAEEAAINGEHKSYFEKQGVAVIGAPKSASAEANGVKVMFSGIPATWNGKPTILRYMQIDPGLPSGRKLLGSYWASPEGDKVFDPEMDKIIASFRKAPEAK